MKRRVLFAFVVVLLSLAGPASAGILYDNTVVPGNQFSLNAWEIDGGYAVADSFTLAADSTIRSANIWVWNTGGSSTISDLTSVDWSVVATFDTLTGPDSPFDPTATVIPLASGIGNTAGWNSFVKTITVGATSYNVYEESFATGDVALPASATGIATYWLILSGAVTTSAGPVLWDESDGPSVAFENPFGSLAGQACVGCSGSESFQLLDTTPEPGTLMLLGGGLLLMGGLFRRRAVR